jgi:NADH:ubiquinone oxidoreductase subunit 4 (subunit M)
LAALTAVALVTVTVIHLIDGPGSLSDQAYVGVLELCLAAACAPLAILLVMWPSRGVWDTALALNVAALAVFLASRTIGLPGSTDDVGNWSQLLGVFNMAAEAMVITAALTAFGAQRSAARSRASR